MDKNLIMWKDFFNPLFYGISLMKGMMTQNSYRKKYDNTGRAEFKNPIDENEIIFRSRSYGK
ncbi:MAG: hypothetical protein ACLTAV_06035 [Finegoldia magna]